MNKQHEHRHKPTREKIKSICILSFTHIARDGRVLRQIQYLAPRYKVTVIGYGPPPPRWADVADVQWVQLPEVVPLAQIVADCKAFQLGSFFARLRMEMRRSVSALSLYLGWLWKPLYEWGYLVHGNHSPALRRALAQHHHAYHANDWESIPIMAQAARRHNAHLVIDMHEYAPRQWNNRRGWWHHQQRITRILQQHGSQAAAVTTVAPLLADTYAQEFDFQPIVVMNAPEQIVLPAREFDPNNIRLIHHGIASPVRKPEEMIKAVARCDERYSLHLMFVPSPYIDTLRQLAQQIAPGRVTFHPAVPPEEIVKRIAEFDVGFNFIPPTTFNYLHSLPNKFLESIAAGLAVCIGPSPSMAAVVEQYKLGCIAPSFAPEEIAATLNQTTTEEWIFMRQQARRAAGELHADSEMGKVLSIYQTLFAVPENSSVRHQRPAPHMASAPGAHPVPHKETPV